MSTPMHSSSPLAYIKKGDPETALEIVLSRSWSPGDLDVQPDKDGTALFWAALRGYSMIVEVLIMLGADVNARSVASGATPLHGSSDNGQTNVTKILLSSGANVSARNFFKDTPCHLAAYRGNAEIVCELLKNGTDCTLRNSRGNTILDEAKCGQYTIAGGQHPLVLHIINAHVNSDTGDDTTSISVTSTEHSIAESYTTLPPRIHNDNQSIQNHRTTSHRHDNNRRHCKTCTCNRAKCQ